MCDNLSAEVATNWYYELQDAIASLKKFPNRCSIAPEAPMIDREIRQLWVGKRRKYRVLFIVEENTVAILHVRNSRQYSLGEESEQGFFNRVYRVNPHYIRLWINLRHNYLALLNHGMN